MHPTPAGQYCRLNTLYLFYIQLVYIHSLPFLFQREGNWFEMDKKRAFMLKSLHIIYAFPYFAMHVVMMDLFESHDDYIILLCSYIKVLAQH
jgi:hypothetical protein